MATHFCILAWRTYGERSLTGYSPWGHKELGMTEANLAQHGTNKLITKQK